MAHSDDAHAADVFDFVDAYVASVERGEQYPLAHWLARFPASQEAVAHEWLALRRPPDAPVDSRTDGLRHAAVTGPDRIGPYRLIAELGRGGQGTVFLAEDSRILRRVALKVLASRFDTIRDDKLRRFRREAEIIARLEHPSLCTVYEADLEGDTPYLAMRYVEGRTLAEVLADAKKADESSGPVTLDAGDDTTPHAVDAHLPPRTKLELDQVLLFFERAARALHAAHEAGVVHRDVKPGNMIVTLDGKPVLLDFGLARDESETDASRITESGEVFGTPSYMSPEQLQFASDTLDRRTDVYSLGVALYEALTLHRPFEQAARPALYVAIQSQAAPDPRTFNANLPEDVAVVLETALEKDRARRYATALDLAEDLRRIRQYEPIRARPASIGLRFARWVRRHPALAAATIGTIVSLTAGLLVALQLLAAETRAVHDKDVALDEKDAALSEKDTALNAKDAALAVALGKHLAQRSIELASEDASAALALGIRAAELAPGYQTMSALYPALESCWLERVLAGDDDSKLMTDLAVGPRGRYVVGAFPEGAAIVWDLVSGARVARIAPGHGAIDLVAIAPRSAEVAIASNDGSITFADLESGAVRATLATGQRASRIAYSADGAHVLARAATGAVRVVDAGTHALAAESAGPWADAYWLAGGRIALVGTASVVVADLALEPVGRSISVDGTVRSVDVSRDGMRIAVASSFGSIELIDTADGLVVARTRSNAGPAVSVALSPDGERAALRFEGDEHLAYVWNPGAPLVELRGPAPRAAVRLRFSPDSTLVATVGDDPIVRVFDAKGGALVRTLTLTKRQLDVAWSPDGSRIVSSASGFAYTWFACARPDTFDLAGHTGAVRALRVAADGTRFVSASSDGTARIWTVADGSLEHVLGGEDAGARGLRRPLVDARFAAHDAYVVALDEDGVSTAFDARTGARIAELRAQEGPLASLQTSANSTSTVLVAENGRALVWDLATPESPPIRLDADRDDGRTTCAAFLANGTRIALGSSTGRVRVFDASNLKLESEFGVGRSDAKASSIVALAVSTRGDELAVGGADRFVRFRRPGDTRDSRPEQFIFYLRALEWDPSGSRVLALAAQPGTKAVRVVDLAGSTTVMPHNAHRANITCAAFSADGERVLTGATDGSLFVWSARDGSPVVQRSDLGSGVVSAVFLERADGSSVAAGLTDGRVRVWPLDPLAAARRRQPRELSDWERKRESALAAPLPFD